MGRIVVAMTLVALAAGCAAGSGPSGPATTGAASATGVATASMPASTASGSATAQATDGERPIDPSVEPVSASDPPPGAAAAMEACGVETRGSDQ